MTLPIDPARYGAFLGVMAVMAMTPGPANLFAIATGAQKGKAAALMGVIGMNAATLVWFVAAALGLGALVLAWPAVFHILTYAGAAYVAWLGLKSLIGAAKGGGDGAHALAPMGPSALRDGFAVQIANPKAILFFTAVLPPFLDPARPMAPQLSAFAVATIGMDVLAMSAYGLGGSAIASRMQRPAFRRGFAVATGLLLLAAAALIMLRE